MVKTPNNHSHNLLMDRIQRDLRIPCSFLEDKFIFSMKRKTFVTACLSEVAAYH